MDKVIVATETELEQLIAKVIDARIGRVSAIAMPADPIKEIINTETLCKRLDITEPTIIRWRKKGKIPFLQVGTAIRYDYNNVIKALEKPSVKQK